METINLIHWVNDYFKEWRQARQESRLVNSINRELLDLYGRISAQHPQLGDRERFNKLVMNRNGCDEASAYAILRSAEDSYAAWPLERELTLCDVIHYLAVREFFAQQGDELGMRGNVTASVKAIVPDKLCRIRLKQPYLSERRKNSRAIED
jgi:hypothetical protein